jgi:hypothetical protein
MEMDIDGCGERKPTRQHCLGRITLINPSSIFFTDKNKKKLAFFMSFALLQIN